eukprot:gene45833-57122_t
MSAVAAGVTSVMYSQPYFEDSDHDKFCGSGSLTLPFGKYSGDFREGQMHGFGEMKYSNGQRYTGEYKDGHIQGRGVLIYADGVKVEGEWLNGQLEGPSVCTYSNGDVYKGTWEGNRKVGSVVFEPANA